MSLCLKGFLSDLVQQIGQSNVILDQRHYRLLLNLSALEKVTPETRLKPQPHCHLNWLLMRLYYSIASIIQIGTGMELECGQPNCHEILAEDEHYEHVRIDGVHVQSECRKCAAHF